MRRIETTTEQEYAQEKPNDKIENVAGAVGAASPQVTDVTQEPKVAATLTFFGEPQPQFSPGDSVQVRVEDGSWRGGLRAISGIEEGEGEYRGSKVVWACWEDEWQTARLEGREPAGAPWPCEWVEFWKPGSRTVDHASADGITPTDIQSVAKSGGEA